MWISDASPLRTRDRQVVVVGEPQSRLEWCTELLIVAFLAGRNTGVSYRAWLRLSEGVLSSVDLRTAA